MTVDFTRAMLRRVSQASVDALGDSNGPLHDLSLQYPTARKFTPLGALPFALSITLGTPGSRSK
jgi:hypothetical protein